MSMYTDIHSFNIGPKYFLYYNLSKWYVGIVDGSHLSYKSPTLCTFNNHFPSPSPIFPKPILVGSALKVGRYQLWPSLGHMKMGQKPLTEPNPLVNWVENHNCDLISAQITNGLGSGQGVFETT